MRKRLICLLLILILVIPNVSFAAQQEEKHVVQVPSGSGLLVKLNIIPEGVDMAKSVTVNEFYAVLKALGSITEPTLQSDDAITARTVIKELIDLLEYGVMAEAKGGYPNGYMVVAKELKLLKNTGIKSYDGSISNASMIQMLLNVLETPVLSVESINSKLHLTYEEGDTLLYKKFGVTKFKGVMTGTEKSTVYGATYLEKDQIEIDKNVYKTEEGYFELLGYSVIAYFDEDRETVIYVEADDKKNDTAVIKTADVRAADNRKITYCVDGKYYSETISAQLPVLKNGVFSGFVSSVGYEGLIPERGVITLIDNNNDGSYDLVSVKKYDLYVVERVNSSRQVISFKNNKPAILLENNDDREVEYSLRYMDNPAELSDIKEWDVLAIRYSKNTDNKEFYELDIIRRTIEGTYTAIGEDYITIDDTDYKILEDFDRANAKLGEDYVFVFAGEDDIISYHERDDFEYGYLVAIEKYFRKTVEIMIVDTSGEEKIYQLDEKIRVNGKRVKSIDLLDDNIFFTNGVTNHQLIKYRIQGNNLTEFYTTQHTYSDQNFDGDYFFSNVNRASRYEKMESYGMFFSLAPGAVSFFVQEPEEGETLSADDVSIGNLSGDSEKNYDCSFYDVSDGGEAKAAVFYNTASASSIPDNIPLACFVDKVFVGRADDGEMYPMLQYRYYFDGTLKTVRISDNVQKIEQSTFYQSKLDDSRITSISDLKRGDIVQLSTNKDGEIDSFRVLFLIDDATAGHGAVVKVTNTINSPIDIIHSPIYVLENDKVTVQYSETSKRTYDLTLSGSRYFKAYAVDSEREELTVGGYSNALSAAETGDAQTADEIVLVIQHGYVRAVMVINK